MPADDLAELGVLRVSTVLSRFGGECTIVFDLKTEPAFCVSQIDAMARDMRLDPRSRVYLVWKDGHLRADAMVLRARDYDFETSPTADGIAAKFDGSRANVAAIGRAVRAGHVNLFAPDARLVDQMIARFGYACSFTV